MWGWLWLAERASMYTLWIYSEGSLVAHWRISQRALENRMKSKRSINSTNELYQMFRLRFLQSHQASTTNKRDYSMFLDESSLRIAVNTGQAYFNNLRYDMQYT